MRRAMLAVAFVLGASGLLRAELKFADPVQVNSYGFTAVLVGTLTSQ